MTASLNIHQILYRFVDFKGTLYFAELFVICGIRDKLN